VKIPKKTGCVSLAVVYSAQDMCQDTCRNITNRILLIILHSLFPMDHSGAMDAILTFRIFP